jgi:hypothetical protein
MFPHVIEVMVPTLPNVFYFTIVVSAVEFSKVPTFESNKLISVGTRQGTIGYIKVVSTYLLIRSILSILGEYLVPGTNPRCY